MEETNFPAKTGFSTSRLEALTDATFAIIMTLLVLELKVPEYVEKGLAGELVHQLPSVWSFVISFVVLGVYWAAHHTQFQYIKRADHVLVWLNIFYLMFLSFIPFAAGLLGRHGGDAVAIQVYSGTLIVATLLHFALWKYATDKKRLIEEWVDPRLIRFGFLVSFYGIVGYALAFVSAIFSIKLGIFLLAVVPIPFVLGLFYRILKG